MNSSTLTPKTEALLRDLIAACKKHGCELSGLFAVHVASETNSYESSFFDITDITAEGVETRKGKIL